MARLERQMRELRGLRDSAKGLLREDVALMRGERGGKTVGPRLMDNASDKARQTASQGRELVGEHKLKIGTGVALGIGAFAAWIFRDRIEQAFDQLLEYVADDDVSEDSQSGNEEAHSNEQLIQTTE